MLLASVYENSDDKEDQEKAFRWYERAAEAGIPEALAELAYDYDQGFVVEKDRKKAVSLYKKAIAMGHEESLMSLALLCLEEKDEKNGFLYMNEAAEAGIPRAQYAAGMMYLEGHGTEENRDEAFRWIEAAAENGVDEAEAVLEHNGYMI